ncbi:MAG: type II secretion system major pseudopilin GspG [Phycisphaeraceae bacterium]
MTRCKRAGGPAGRGFTIVEVLVVVVIIGVLAAMIVPQLLSKVGKAKRSTAKQQVAALEQAVQTFALDYDNRMPQSLDELVSRPADIPADQWAPPSIKEKNLVDPWGNPYVYEYPGQHGTFDLYSLGADGREGGEGENADVTNW